MSQYVEEGEQTLDEWSQSLRNGSALSYLSSLDIRALSEIDAVSLLNNLILTMYDESVYDDGVLDAVLSTFEIIRPSFSRSTPMEIAIVALPLIDLGALSWVWMRKNVDVRTVIFDLSGWLGNEAVPIVMSDVARVFLREDVEEIYDPINNPARDGTLADVIDTLTIIYLMDNADDKGNDGMWNYLRGVYAVNAPLVGPGPWMMEEKPQRILPLPRAYIDADPLREETVTLLTENIPPTSLESVTSIVRCDAGIVDSMTKRDKYGINDDRFSSFEEERELFRLYGPSNVFFTDDDEDAPPGSDRMLTCSIYNYDEDFDIPEPIYTGTCDWKGHKISSERAAVRRPVSGGGWTGSYCSTLCIREQVEDSRATGSILDPDGVLAMVDVMESQLLQWGIYSSIDI